MTGASSDSIHVLHVDDEPDFAAVAAEFVERQDPRVAVETATNATDGLERIRANGTQCVVSDYDMPGQNGIEFLEAVRMEYPDLPFILFTGKGSEEVASEAISSGVTDYLQKESGTSQYEILCNRIGNAVEQFRTQEAIAETEERLRTISENTNDVLWMFSADWTELRFINTAYEEIWGRTMAELRERPRSFLEGIHPDDRAHVQEAMATLTDGDSVDIEYRVNADEDFGRLVWVKGEPVVDDSGSVTNVVGFARDITERKEHDRALRELESRYRSITEDVLDATEVGIFVLDADFKVAWCNEAVEAFFGVDRDAIIGRDKRRVIEAEITDVLEDPEHFAEKVLGTYDDNSYTEQFECHVLGSDGRAGRWLGHLSHPIETGLFEGGRVEIYTDITERKEREQRLERQNAQLDEFTSIISHDLRNPLSVAAGRLELARDGHDTAHLEATARALDRMEALIEDVLELARTGAESTDTRSVLISDVIDGNWRGSEPRETTTHVTMRGAIQADPSQLDQLLENLVRNASEHGGSDVTVTIGGLPDGFYVEDDGPGIPHDERDRIFDTGYTTKPEGTGFGLNVVKQVVEAHGWEISVTDQANGGARFEVTGVGMG